MRSWIHKRFGKNKHVFGKFLFSYFLILLFPLTIGAYAYQQTVKVVREDAVELNQTVLEHSKQSLNSLFAEIREVVSVISLDKDLLALILLAEAEWSPESIYQFSLQRNELYKLSTNNYFSGLFVYLAKSETIIANDHISRLHEHPLQIGDLAFGEWLEDVVSKEEVNRYHRLENVDGGKERGNYIAYVSGLPAGHRTHIDGAVVILIREQSVLQLFNRSLDEKGAFAYILDEENRLIASTFQGHPPIESALLDGGPRDGYEVYNIDGSATMISHTRSAYNGWTYVSGLPEAAVFAKAEYIKRINYSIIAAALLIGCIAALLFAYRNSRPVQELLESLSDLRVRMDKQQLLLRSAYLERLLKNGFNTRGELLGYGEQARMQLSVDGEYVVALIRIHGQPYVETGHADLGSGISLLESVVENCQPDWLLHQLKPMTMALVIPLSSSVAAEDKLDWAEAALLQLQERLLQERQLLCSIGLGQVAGNAMQIWRSYNDARQALDVLDPELTQQLSRYDALGKHSAYYYYPPDLELKLMNTVRVGDTAGLERLLGHIETENFVQRQLSPWRTKQLFQEIQGTLQKLTEQLSRLPGSDIPALVKLEHAELEHPVPDMGMLRVVLTQFSEQIRQQKTSRHRKLFEEIKATIAADYKDSGLSLCQIAANQKQTESFISILFKEQMGVTFSEYVEQLRLNEACRLLRATELPIVEISLMVGYNSDKSFRRAFKRAYGIQPTSFRKVPGAQTDP
ncbi:helix-turn-helix domain-containing protein [Paenibacillus sp. 1P07SE]|uniref:helix-turn-helix domain-containing protein n=1 Tax=Paenibacillus sp. 1P07SE TaxID=3132209 RepID=UPI0039A4DF1E